MGVWGIGSGDRIWGLESGVWAECLSCIIAFVGSPVVHDDPSWTSSRVFGG